MEPLVTVAPGVPGRATVLCTTPGGYRFDTERVRIDLHDFEERIRRAGHTAPAQALPFWESAVSVADGTLLATEPYAAWAVDARRAHERALHAAAAAGAEIALALREAERAVPLARLATELAGADDAVLERMASFLAAAEQRTEDVIREL